jgi:hypothetical protein
MEIVSPDDHARHVYQEGETLVVDYSNGRDNRILRKIPLGKMTKIIISLPDLENVEFSGAGKLDISGFHETDMEITLEGAITAEGDVSVDNLELNLAGVSTLDLKGHGNFMDASVVGASELKAYNYETNHAIVEALGTSSAKVNATQKLETTTNLTSTISHRGDPEILIEKD